MVKLYVYYVFEEGFVVTISARSSILVFRQNFRQASVAFVITNRLLESVRTAVAKSMLVYYLNVVYVFCGHSYGIYLRRCYSYRFFLRLIASPLLFSNSIIANIHSSTFIIYSMVLTEFICFLFWIDVHTYIYIYIKFLYIYCVYVV